MYFQIVGLPVIQLVKIYKFIHNGTAFSNITDSFCGWEREREVTLRSPKYINLYTKKIYAWNTNAQKNNYIRSIPHNLINLINMFIYFNRVTFPKVTWTSASPKTAKDYEENETTSLLLAMSSLQNEDWRQAQRCWCGWGIMLKRKNRVWSNE